MEEKYPKSDKFPLTGGIGFETFVMHLLKELCDQDGKPFLFGTEFGHPYFDGFAEDGISSLEGETGIAGRTIIEVKDNLTSERLLKDKSLFYNLIVGGIRFDNLLLVANENLSEIAIKHLSERVQSISPSAKVYFWGPKELQKLANRFPIKSKELGDNIFTYHINKVLSKSTVDWKEERQLILTRLASKYQKGQMSLFLGAGLSSSAGMVDWKILLDSLFINLISTSFSDGSKLSDEDIKQITERFSIIQDGSSVALARYLRAGLASESKGEEKFIDAVRKGLYSLRNQEFPLDSKLFKTVAKLCMPTRTGSKIRSIITYNFDDLLERSLEKNNIRHSSIYSDNNSYTLDDLPIYHVHGFLPEDSSNYEGLERNTFVFSEEGYHKIYSEPYHWSNLVQLNSLRELNCVFIGLSMTDPNLRRLLDLAAKNPDEARHFVFMKRFKTDDFIYSKEITVKGKKEKVQKINNIPAATSFIDNHLKLQEQVFTELGVSVIWYEQHDEIPDLLTNVYGLSISS